MRYLFSIISLSLLFASCSNNKETASAKPFCDTTCNTDTFKFAGDHKLKPVVTISVNNCIADTLSFSHEAMPASRQVHMGTYLGHLVRLNNSAISAYFKDTSYVWLTFNDCATGRGYLLKLPFNKKESIRKMSSAINSFDKKFVLPEDLRAYADYSTIYVEDIATGKSETMTFKEEYKIDWDNIHETIDSVNISRNRIYVQLKKDGQIVPIEKNISL
ncbi:hypothetical protein OCK74_03060 [Chitinophagaceae bacterium LB-8]|uniref:Lipoprotein n=1 Tax=Paraflavisolibacter caeni TaxID=2982496 RepID=A0A9X2XS87_9BACT|nr:hypothetical protein [Paraflavisolibacter caeni]MCU7548074.1 hypothetical protein [Paraflavisolibacter caeni]